MSHKWTRAMAPVLVLALLAALCFGCAEKAEEKKVIVVGLITDFTGPTSTACRLMNIAMEDLIEYVNEQDPIPGAKLKLVAYDEKFDPARDLPAYDFCRERGASLIVTASPSAAETLKPFLEKDNVAIFSTYSTKVQMEPPGWIFASVPTCVPEVKTLLRYVSQDWDYELEGRKPKLGCVGWSFPGALEYGDAASEYCRAHPDDFDYIGMAAAPNGTMMWTGEVERLKNCDYVFLATVPPAASTFLHEFRSKGYTAKCLTTQAIWGFTEMMEEQCGQEALDGTLAIMFFGTWDYPCPLMDLAKELLYENHPGEADAVIRSGLGYSGGLINLFLCVEILREAVEEVGAENFDGAAFYNAAIKFTMTAEGFPEWTFADGIRFAQRHECVWQYSAELGDLVRLTDWLPLIE